ncbi:MAG: pyridoxal phosphate-dependent aminotransferase [bacterium]|nr:pyridoxal phosphate-dependent aminotransferase [bacterium]
MILSKRASKIAPSITLAISAKAKQMQAEGIDVIGFGAGEPDFDTPGPIKEAAIAAIESGFTKYTADSGIPELKKAVCEKFKRDNNLEYEPSQILISSGAKHSLFNAIFVLCDDGDEVIIPAPYWVSYEEQVKMAGATTVIVETQESNDFKLTPELFQKAITPKTKAIILNSPCNPTGTVYERDELESLANAAVEHGIYVIADEIYEYLVYDGVRHHSIAGFGQKVKDLTITINGVSKAYSMTGWRIGYAAGPKEIIQAMANVQSHATSNAVSISQKAALAALAGSQDCIAQMVVEFDRRRQVMVAGLNKIKGFSCRTPKGAFYSFPNTSCVYGLNFNGKPINNSFALTEFLLDEARVAVVPGGAFGAPNYIRLSYATSLKNIENGLERIQKAIDRLAL